MDNIQELLLQNKADEIAGIMYKLSDCDDDNTWLPSDKFHEVAIHILIKKNNLEDKQEPKEDEIEKLARDYAQGLTDDFSEQNLLFSGFIKGYKSKPGQPKEKVESQKETTNNLVNSLNEKTIHKEKVTGELSEFIAACKQERDHLVNFINSFEWRTDLRTHIENILVMYDQMQARLEKVTNEEDKLQKAIDWCEEKEIVYPPISDYDKEYNRGLNEVKEFIKTIKHETN